MPEFARTSPTARAAFAYAERLHAGQLRATDGAPFILHPLEVATLLYEDGAPDALIAAGVLHETLEKTDATAYELSARFGRRVGDIVRALTDEDRIARSSRRVYDPSAAQEAQPLSPLPRAAGGTAAR